MSYYHIAMALVCFGWGVNWSKRDWPNFLIKLSWFALAAWSVIDGNLVTLNF